MKIIIISFKNVTYFFKYKYFLEVPNYRLILNNFLIVFNKIYKIFNFFWMNNMNQLHIFKKKKYKILEKKII